MKTSIKIWIASALMLPAVSFAAETIKKDLGTFTDWRAAEIINHDLWNKDACLASTAARGDTSTLELYAEKDAAHDGYVEPTFQVVARKQKVFIRAILMDDKQTQKFGLTLATNAANPTAFGTMARLEDRAAILSLLKSANGIIVQLVGPRNKLVKTLTFSLKGSSKAIAAAVTGCQLNLAADQ